MLEHLSNMGYCESSGMGQIPLSFKEIEAYINTTNTPLNAQEVMIIRKCSQSYVGQMQKKSPLETIPFDNDEKVELSGDEALLQIDSILW